MFEKYNHNLDLHFVVYPNKMRLVTAKFPFLQKLTHMTKAEAKKFSGSPLTWKQPDWRDVISALGEGEHIFSVLKHNCDNIFIH